MQSHQTLCAKNALAISSVCGVAGLQCRGNAGANTFDGLSYLHANWQMSRRIKRPTELIKLLIRHAQTLRYIRNGTANDASSCASSLQLEGATSLEAQEQKRVGG